ncbi:hypothetical protein OC835_005089 [Tilletia horrida]|nr:hypothetical protein OC835_005089 [Tilletia horrida]
MRHLSALIWAYYLLCLLSALLLTAPTLSSAARRSETVVIVSFRSDQQGTATSKARTPQTNTTLHDGFEKYLADRKIPYKTRFRFTDVRMPLGISLRLDNAADMPRLYAYPPVIAVEKVQAGPFSAIQKHGRRSSGHHDVVSTHLILPRQHDSSSSSSSSTDARATIPAALNQPDRWGPHIMTGADKLHNEGIFGAGVKIGVVDTGIDASHPAFGNCYRTSPNCTIVGGAAFVNDDNFIALSDDPRPNCGDDGDLSSSWGHGTHVAGVIGAIDTTRNFTGMAPLAKLSMYRIAGCTGVSAPDVAVAAIMRAYLDGMDIISMSFSFQSGWATAFASRFVSSIVALGVPVVLSEGNSGGFGLAKSLSPTVADGAFPIGSVQNSYFPGWTFRITVAGSTQVNTSTYVSVNPYKFAKNMSSTLPVYATSKTLKNLNDACNNLPDSTPDLSKFMVLIRRSPNCRPSVQIVNAQDKGAKNIMFYNDKTSEIVYADEFLDPGQGQASMISNADGVAIAKLLLAGKKVRLDLSAPRGTVYNNTATGGLMGDYSEYGPSWTGAGMPGISAVGGQVLSTWPVVAGKYAVLEGTSFSCPQVAGAMALYQSVKGKSETPAELQAIFTTTATPVTSVPGSAVLDSTVHQGGGLLNVYKAVKSTSRVAPYQLLLNDTHSFQGTHTLTVKNVGRAAQTYTLKHQPAGTVYGTAGSDKVVYYNDGPLPPQAQDQASVSFSPASLTVAPGASKNVTVSFRAPAIDAVRFGVYSGFVQLVSSDADGLGSLSVPYMGLALDFTKVPMLNMTVSADNGDAPQTQLRDPTDLTPLASDNKTFDLTEFEQRPQLQWGYNYGSPYANIALVRANTSFVPTYRQGGSLSPTRPARDPKTGTCASVPAADLVVPSVETDILLDRQSGDPSYTYIMPQWTDLKSGEVKDVPDGAHVRVLLSVRRPNVVDEPCAYETYLSRAFTVKNSPRTKQ